MGASERDESGDTIRLLPVIAYGVHWIDETSGEGHEEFDSREFRDDPSDAERRVYIDKDAVLACIESLRGEGWGGPIARNAHDMALDAVVLALRELER